MNGGWFGAYVEQIFAPTLRPGDVVILDNLPAHKAAAARDATRATGAQVLFPASCSRNTAMICSSLNLLFFTSASSQGGL